MTFSCPLTTADTANWTQHWDMGWAQAFGWVRPGQSVGSSKFRGAYLTDIEGQLDVSCQVCGVGYHLFDSDPRPGYVRIDNVSWGAKIGRAHV